MLPTLHGEMEHMLVHLRNKPASNDFLIAIYSRPTVTGSSVDVQHNSRGQQLHSLF